MAYSRWEGRDYDAARENTLAMQDARSQQKRDFQREMQGTFEQNANLKQGLEGTFAQKETGLNTRANLAAQTQTGINEANINASNWRFMNPDLGQPSTQMLPTSKDMEGNITYGTFNRQGQQVGGGGAALLQRASDVIGTFDHKNPEDLKRFHGFMQKLPPEQQALYSEAIKKNKDFNMALGGYMKSLGGQTGGTGSFDFSERPVMRKGLFDTEQNVGDPTDPWANTMSFRQPRLDVGAGAAPGGRTSFEAAAGQQARTNLVGQPPGTTLPPGVNQFSADQSLAKRSGVPDYLNPAGNTLPPNDSDQYNAALTDRINRTRNPVW